MIVLEKDIKLGIKNNYCNFGFLKDFATRKDWSEITDELWDGGAVIKIILPKGTEIKIDGHDAYEGLIFISISLPDEKACDRNPTGSYVNICVNRDEMMKFVWDSFCER